MTTLDGCVVKEVFNHPSGNDVVALRGVWSGGNWTSKATLTLRHQREEKFVGLWTIVGAERTTNGTDPLILVKPSHKNLAIHAGDTLLLGDHTVATKIVLRSTDLPHKRDCSVQFSVARFHGVLIHTSETEITLTLFHRPDATLFSFEEQPIFWQGKQYRAHILLEENNVFLNFKLAGENVRIKSLLDTLTPLRAFTLDAGQQLLYQRRAGRKKRLVYDFFEPALQVSAGSVVVKVLPGKPSQLPLIIRPSEPLRLLVESFTQAVNGSVQELILALSSHVPSTESLLQHLLSFGRAALKCGGVVVTFQETGKEFPIDLRFLNTIENALSSLQWREVLLTGQLYAIETGQRWFRIAVQSQTTTEHWTIHFDHSWSKTIEGGVVPRMVAVRFATAAPESATSGRGELIAYFETK